MSSAAKEESIACRSSAGSESEQSTLESAPHKDLPQIKNVVSTARLNTDLNLLDIAVRGKNTEYNSRKFRAVFMTNRELRTTASIFANGKIVCTGAQSEADSHLTAKWCAKAVRKLGYKDASLSDFSVQNMAGTWNLGHRIGLQDLHDSLTKSGLKDFSYAPELFPGLIFRMARPKVVLKIFASGKIGITGAKNAM